MDNVEKLIEENKLHTDDDRDKLIEIILIQHMKLKKIAKIECIECDKDLYAVDGIRETNRIAGEIINTA